MIWIWKFGFVSDFEILVSSFEFRICFMNYDVIIIGSGPAGLTAAIYASRDNLKTLVVGGAKWGGQLMLTTQAENYPGFPEGIQGPDLMTAMRKQAEHHGAEIIDKDFVSGDFSLGSPFKVRSSEQEHQA